MSNIYLIGKGNKLINIKGCAGISKSRNILVNFLVGDIAYVKPSAKKGILEKVRIKKIIMNNGYLIYKDNINAYYNYDELISYYDALIYAQNYYEDKKTKLLQLIDNWC